MSEKARKAEANDEKTATVEFRGRTFSIPLKYDDYSVDLVESLEEGKVVGIVRGFLGPNQWRVVRGMDLKMADLNELSGRLAKAAGFGDTGESQASSD